MTPMRVVALAEKDPLACLDRMRELQHRWMIWDACVEGRRRVDLHPLVLSPAAHANAIEVAEAAAALVARAGERAARDVEERALYKLPADCERLAAAANAAGDRGALVRVDLLLGADGKFRACEVNTDSPGGYNEVLALPRLARLAGFRGGEDPSPVPALLADRLVAMASGHTIGLVYGTTWAEDLQICAIVQRLVHQRGGRAVLVPPTALAAAADGSIVYRGERIAVLYRYYPLEYMDGQRNVEALARATERGLLTAMSSFAVIHSQSKLAMARAWAHEPWGASRVFPETFAIADVEREMLLEERADWVVKLDLSRVGDHVFVGALMTDADWRTLLAEIDLAAEEQEVWIAQRFVREAPIPTPWGPRNVTLGAYVLDGSFVGYFARLSPTSHCSHDALVLPVFVAQAPRAIAGAA